jgi:hypothetical protein
VEIILASEEEVSKIQPPEVEPQTKLVEEEVKNIETKVHVKTIELEVGVSHRL